MLKKNIDILGFPALLSTVAWQDTRISIKIRQRFLSRHPRDRTNRATSSRRGRDDRHKTKDPGATDDNMATDENDDQRFCLRWNNFQSNIWSQFDVLRCDEDFTDVTIACEGRRVRAHKIILSACSPYFKELFKDNPCSHPIIFMRDVGVEHIAALMEFMYAGEVNISQENLSAFLKIADSLKIRGLSDVPFDRKTGNVAPEVDPPMETSGHHNVSDTKVGPGRLEDVTTPPEREATVKFEPVDFRNDGNTAGDCTVFSECNQEFDCNELGIEQGELGYVKKRYIRDTFPSEIPANCTRWTRGLATSAEKSTATFRTLDST
ncbi:protein bric-a-brac 1-like isoform X2 [Cylas formicarius]|uniref:protein bric-a-brac 1-like isoform X2 n=1 Tax=Cylas formicarius TaxID=197179 RepID=UPI002958955B|nr:protein bric-a-brac 1-like isoform X2 [Cylas formicarius]